MPFDKKGAFQLNHQRANASNRMADKGGKSIPGGGPAGGSKADGGIKAEPERPGMSEDGGEKASVDHTVLHSHGDGTYHTEHSDGTKVEHPHIGHALMHHAAHHEPDAKHMHVHQDGMGQHTTHHVGEDGQVQGPHQHADLEAVKAHMDGAMGEGGEGGEGGDMEEGGMPMHSGMAGI